MVADPSTGNGIPTDSSQRPATATNHSQRGTAARTNLATGGFVVTDGEIRRPGSKSLNQTDVDVVVVPCVGGHHLATWNGNHDNLESRRARQSWVTTQLRSEVKFARVLLYQHREPADGDTLETYAKELLEALLKMRQDEQQKTATGQIIARPLFFIGHSVGGLVIKLAMSLAGDDRSFQQYRGIFNDCYSICFFGTPQRGSKFLATSELARRIQQLLNLSRPLPLTLRRQLEPNNAFLKDLQDKFKYLLGEMWLWTFYETKEVELTVPSLNGRDLTFREPITSFKSCLLDSRHEILRAVPANHTRLPFFDSNNDLAERYIDWFHYFMEKAKYMVKNEYANPELATNVTEVKQEVQVEIRGIFQAQEGSQDLKCQLWTARSTFPSFIRKGPLRCLEDRLDNNSQVDNGTMTPGEMEESAATLGPHPAGTGDNFVDNGFMDPDHDSEIVLEKRPSLDSLQYSWIHLPHNNPAWVKELLDGVAESCPINIGEILAPEHWASRFAGGRLNQHHANFVHPGSDIVPMNTGNAKTQTVEPTFMYIHLPYLHFDSYCDMIRRRHTIDSRWNRARTKPVPTQLAKDRSVERRMLWRYLGYEPAIHFRRTLDQFGYPALGNTKPRDDDQMLYKRTKQQLPEAYRPARKDSHTDTLRKRTNSHQSDLRSDKQSSRNRSWSLEKILTKLPFRQRPPQPLKQTSLHRETTMPADGELDVTGKAESGNALDGNVLMVDQLWLWGIQAEGDSSDTPGARAKRDTIVTFFPEREAVKTEGPFYRYADLRDTIANELAGDDAGGCEDLWDHAALCVYNAVTVLLEQTTLDELNIFRIFEEAISEQSEQMTMSLKLFREEGMADDNDFESTPARIKARHHREGQKEENKYKANISALLELRDIEDELSILITLFAQQSEVIKTMKQRYEESKDRIPNRANRKAFILLDRANRKLCNYTARARDMIKRVEKTRQAFDKLLEMIQRQSQVIETRNSRLQADLAGAQGRSLLVFTIITIIFLPLSFFTSFFGMNTSSFSEAQDTLLSLWKISAIAFPISAAFIILALIFAFSERAARSWDGASRWVVWAMVRTWWRGASKGVKKRGPVPRGGGAGGDGRRGGGGVSGLSGAEGDGGDDGGEGNTTLFKGNAFLGNQKMQHKLPYDNLTADARERRMEEEREDERQQRDIRRYGGVRGG